jgi:hypothetical protein
MTTLIETRADGVVIDMISPREASSAAVTPNRVTFFGFPCVLDDGRTVRLSAHVDVLDGDVQSAIDIVRGNGGLFVPGNGSDAFQYFLPWPCALVQVGPLPAGVAARTGEQ